jgi:hypothetical protein
MQDTLPDHRTRPSETIPDPMIHFAGQCFLRLKCPPKTSFAALNMKRDSDEGGKLAGKPPLFCKSPYPASVPCVVADDWEPASNGVAAPTKTSLI